MKCHGSGEAFLRKIPDFVVFSGAQGGECKILKVNVSSGVKCNKCAFKYGDFRRQGKYVKTVKKLLRIGVVKGAQEVVARLLDMLICKGFGSSFPDILPP
jgi:hypothetical protein